MKRSLREIIKGKSTEELRLRQRELYNKVKQKQKVIAGHKHLITQMESNVATMVQEHNLIDRTIFFREDRIKVLKPVGKGRHYVRREKLINKALNKMSDHDAAEILRRLIEIREERKVRQTSEDNL